ncbi:uncharacterized protein BYT42DRAFT_583954 [Radiomyces spectabilis]|uniref:uncharacterized protein n=1 Tax=Radiomyces spectabilis TaxID=64574 RepID=UPI0022209049|nr:uncharacterized protein BYT42DRAFT_583954 [Radiomyces spectabilis]KAI8369323.1 hypothetical protein BYT42DRAFT_583954 [Radiomyces spectabilis]
MPGGPLIRYRYTSCQKANELKTKKYRRIRETLVSQFPNVKTAQEKLSQHPISVNGLETYCRNLRETASVSRVLSNFCEHDVKPIRIPSFPKTAPLSLFQSMPSRFSIGENHKFVLWMGLGFNHGKLFHEPIRGVGMRRMLKKQGFEVYLLDEFKRPRAVLTAAIRWKNSRRCPIPGHTDERSNQKYYAMVC